LLGSDCIVGIWGFHDRRLTLRKALCSTLTESSVKDAFRRRWRYHQSQVNKQVVYLSLVTGSRDAVFCPQLSPFFAKPG